MIRYHRITLYRANFMVGYIASNGGHADIRLPLLDTYHYHVLGIL